MTFSKFATILVTTAVLAGCSGMQQGENVDTSGVGVSNNISASSEIDGVAAYEASQGLILPTASSEELQRDMASKIGQDRVLFGFDSASLSAESQAYLKKVAEYVLENNISSLIVEGHCDERGTREYNLALGDRRAVAVKRYLVGLGVSPRNISTVSYGKERPATAGHTKEAWAQNRRAVVVFN